MIIGNSYGSGCKGPHGQHVIGIDYGDWLWCLVCDGKIEVTERPWWRDKQERDANSLESTG